MMYLNFLSKYIYIIYLWTLLLSNVLIYMPVKKLIILIIVNNISVKVHFSIEM